jgi:8-oxo-dGTP pyrophosphatase MutT (NUDIX family)
MPIEKSAGAVIFRREGGNIYYLLLHYPSGSRKPKSDYWDFPKGHIEKGEKEIETVKREVKEETGLTDLEFVEGFKEWIKYFFKAEGKTVFKIVTFYLAKTKTKDVKISFEHIGYEWLVYQDALKRLTFDNAKEILKRANQFLIGLNSKSKNQNAK